MFDPRAVPALDSLEIRVQRLVEGRHLGLHRSPFRGASAEFAEHRPYLAGDDLRDLDWRIYARTDRYYVKRYEAETNLSAQVLVDATASMDFGRKWDAAALLAGATSYLLAAQGDAVGIFVSGVGGATDGSRPRQPSATDGGQSGGGGVYLPPKRGRGRRREILACLDGIRPGGARDGSRPRQPSATDGGQSGGNGDGSLIPAIDRALLSELRKGLLILISDFLSDDLESLTTAFRRIRGRGHDALVLHIVSRDELWLEDIGPTRYVDPESGLTLETVPEDIRSEYRRRLDAHLKGVADACRALAFDHLLVVAEDGPGLAFGKFLASRRRR